ncbi:hypothetical protein Pmani_018837 [Petrolisthes manimaculis]|uniref:SCAN box domain-containing protein n=1 Tax=Petrolisthes manimaculis TaxID=1843537 RepID=A0AAE1U4J1_9EUCA|nr:hypothetical protein Pmani_018837 [Petrolisthes manimaculis]
MKTAHSLGMSPEAIEKLVQQEICLQKDKAEIEERYAEKEQRKLELEQEQLVVGQRRHESDHAEAEKARVEAAEVRAHELRLAELHSAAGSNHDPGNTMFHDLKLPTFNDNHDDIDSFLLRFERIAGLHQWKKSDYHIYLGSLLRGQALKVYVSLPNDVVTNYEKVKEALLRAYSVDADSFRYKFRESKCGDNESFTQLVVRMGQYLERWISLSDVAKDYASLFDFLIREQLLSNCNPELRVFLKEREFNNSQDMADAADKWKSAHHYRIKSSKPPQATRPSQPIAKERDKTLNVCHGCVMDSLFENQNDSPQELTLAGDLPSDSLDVSLSRFPPHESKVCVDNNISEVIQDQNVTMAVQTRAGKKKDGKTVELKCPVMDDLEMNRRISLVLRIPVQPLRLLERK